MIYTQSLAAAAGHDPVAGPVTGTVLIANGISFSFAITTFIFTTISSIMEWWLDLAHFDRQLLGCAVCLHGTHPYVFINDECRFPNSSNHIMEFRIAGNLQWGCSLLGSSHVVRVLVLPWLRLIGDLSQSRAAAKAEPFKAEPLQSARLCPAWVVAAFSFKPTSSRLIHAMLSRI